MCGTPLYFSPEIVKGKSYDQRTDLWAVGIMTYELIVGSIPFRIWT
jgi:aurora kinase